MFHGRGTSHVHSACAFDRGLDEKLFLLAVLGIGPMYAALCAGIIIRKELK